MLEDRKSEEGEPTMNNEAHCSR